MKLFFLKDDSLYKIYKTIEKAPKNKKIFIYIEVKNQFFLHEWRGKQIKELIDKENIQAVFVTQSEQSKKFFEKLGLNVEFESKKQRTQIVELLYLFFFNIRKFHLNMYSKRNYAFYIVFTFEVSIIVGIIYLLYGLVIPSTSIQIHPAYEIEEVIYNFRFFNHKEPQLSKYTQQLTVPYYTGKTEVEYTMTLATKDILYLQNPSHGTVRIVNKTNKAFSLLKNTQIVTDDGLIFFTTKPVRISEAQDDSAGFNYVDVIASDSDTENQIIGDRGNVSKDTRFYIRKLKQSMYKKSIYAEAIHDFVGGETIVKNSVSTGDIAGLKKRIDDYINKNKKKMAKEKVPQNAVMLPFNKLVLEEEGDFDYKVPKGTGNIITGHVNKDLVYHYIKKNDIIKSFEKFIEERKGDTIDVVTLSPESLTFLEMRDTGTGTVFTISTRINMIKGYNFDKDINGILSEIKNNISGMSIAEAKKKILEYKEIASVEININPPRYKNIAKLKSRIFIEIEE